MQQDPFAALPNEPIPYVPSTPVIAEVLEQAVTELDRQKRDGWHLIPITMFEEDADGQPIQRDYRYLETDQP